MSTRLTYFASFPATGKIKIGSSINPNRRLNSLRSHKLSVGPHKLIGAIPSTALSEADAHDMFSKYRVHGEWYIMSKYAIAKIKKLLPENWESQVPKYAGVWMGKRDIANMRKQFPGKSPNDSMRNMVNAILASIKSGHL